MAESVDQRKEQQISPSTEMADEINRIMEIGKILFAVLTNEEVNELQELLQMPSLKAPPVEHSKNR
jgi:hypothetical protein